MFWPSQMCDPAFLRVPMAAVPVCCVRCPVERGMFWPSQMCDPAFLSVPMAAGPIGVCQVRFGVTQVLVRSRGSRVFVCAVRSAALGKVLLCVCSGIRSSVRCPGLLSAPSALICGEGKEMGQGLLLFQVLLCF